MFGKPEKGFTRDEFKEMVLRLGIVVTDKQLDIVFATFDCDRPWPPPSSVLSCPPC